MGEGASRSPRVRLAFASRAQYKRKAEEMGEGAVCATSQHSLCTHAPRVGGFVLHQHGHEQEGDVDLSLLLVEYIRPVDRTGVRHMRRQSPARRHCAERHVDDDHQLVAGLRHIGAVQRGCRLDTHLGRPGLLFEERLLFFGHLRRAAIAHSRWSEERRGTFAISPENGSSTLEKTCVWVVLVTVNKKTLNYLLLE